MNYRNKLIIISIILIFSISIPTTLWIRDYVIDKGQFIDSTILSQYSTFIGMIISFWGLVLNFVLVTIAYKAFKNYDVRKEFHSGQLNIVSELANSLGKSEIANMCYQKKIVKNNKKIQIAEGFQFPFLQIMLSFNYEKFEEFYIRGTNIEIIMPFLEFRSHPLLPKKIADALWKLYSPLEYKITVLKNELPENYVVFSSTSSLSTEKKDLLFLYSDNPEQYIRNVVELRESIISWFKDYGADEINL